MSTPRATPIAAANSTQRQTRIVPPDALHQGVLQQKIGPRPFERRLLGQVFGDLGAGLYTRQYFRNSTRYQIINCSSLGHSVPYFGKTVQKPGKEYRAQNVTYGESTFSFDFAAAYGNENLAALSRVFTVTPDSVTVCDRFDWKGEAPAVERYMLWDEPTVTDGGFTVGGLTCRFTGKVKKIAVVPFEYEIHHAGGSTRGAWFVDAELEEGADGCTLEITF